MDPGELQPLLRLVAYGSSESRRLAVERLVSGDDADWWRLLVRTVRDEGPWLVRARCLEALALALALVEPAVGQSILEELRT